VFDRARRRLTLQALVLFAAVLLIFSVVFYVVLTTVLAPTFDIAPEIPNDEAARAAYHSTTELIAGALVVANVVAILVAGLAGWILAGRTLRPIRDALARQRRFVADASHEMRTPLTVIRSTVDAAIASGPDTHGTTDAFRTVSEATDRLTRMTSDLLLLARTEDGSLGSNASSTDLSVAAAEAVDMARAGLGARIELTLQPDLLVAAGEDALERICGNLIDNAWRYSDGAPFIVRTIGADRWAVLEVVDRGPGIADVDRERIFEPFHRVRADHGAPAGSGLGLAIVRGLVTGLGGRVTVESRLGQGSTFRVELPRHH
jgi:signal transduction histidine kinase